MDVARAGGEIEIPAKKEPALAVFQHESGAGLEAPGQDPGEQGQAKCQSGRVLHESSIHHGLSLNDKPIHPILKTKTAGIEFIKTDNRAVTNWRLSLDPSEKSPEFVLADKGPSVGQKER
jgi:hypothetical protein